jgi:predicted component of type VI protein secretion system
MRMGKLTYCISGTRVRTTFIHQSEVLERQTRVKMNYEYSKYLKKAVRLKTIAIRLELEFLLQHVAAIHSCAPIVLYEHVLPSIGRGATIMNESRVAEVLKMKFG